MKGASKRLVSLGLTVVILMTMAFSAGVTPVFAETDGKKTFSLTSISEIRENFKSYYTPTANNVEDLDSDGVSLYRECDPDLTWDVADGVLKRTGSGEYAGGISRAGAATLYFNDKYENFEISFDYNISNTTTGWKIAGFGFGADDLGGHYVDDGYYTYVEREGTVRMFYEDNEAPLIYSANHTDFKTYCLTSGNWVGLKARVENRNLTLTYTYLDADGAEQSVSVSKAISSSYSGGYVYLIANSQNMQIKNLSISPIDTVTSEYTTEYNFTSIDDVANSFEGYYFGNKVNFGEKDSSGASLISATAVSNVWAIDSDGFLTRQGSGVYDGGGGNKGAALLYFKEKYDDFEISLKYRFSKKSNWGSDLWMGIGFGADNYGECYQTDSYFAVVEKEGVIRLHLKDKSGNAVARYTAENPDYTATLTPTLDTTLWHNMTLRVIGSYAYISYDGGEEFKVYIGADTTGYPYLFANTKGLQFDDIKLTRYFSESNPNETSRNTSVWPECYDENGNFLGYNETRYNSGAVNDIKKASDKFYFKSTAGGNSVPFSITFPISGGVRITGETAGVFAPKSVNSITYTDVDGGIDLKSGNETVKFRYTDTSWQIITQKDGADSVALSSDNLYFSYKDGGLDRIKYDFPIESGEKLYGLGERYNAVNQNGYTVTLWNNDPTYHSSGNLSQENLTDSYINVPVIHSTLGYTMFFNSTFVCEADIGFTNASEYSFDFAGNILDLYIFNGTPEENMQEYTEITGKPLIPEKWAFGYWAGNGRTIYESAFTDAETEKGSALTSEEKEQITAQKVREIMENYAALGVNPTAYYGEGACIDYAESTYPIIEEYGVKPLGWTGPSTVYDTVYTSLKCNPLDIPIIKLASDKYKFFSSMKYAYIDFTNPLSQNLINNLIRIKTNQGLKGYMVDMGEYIAEDTLFYNGKTGSEMHNLYAYYYAKTHSTAMKTLTNDDYVLFARSGSAGSWQYAATFGGDQAAKWYGLEQQLRGLLTASASGFSIYGADIGGLHGRPTDELYMRWVQFSTFAPLMREHGNTATDSLPWTYSSDAQENFVNYYNTREVLLDHIYSGALESGKTGIPMTETLSMAYPDDSRFYGIEDQYLFCNNMLVAPVIAEGVTERNVVLPTGTWYNLLSGEKISGGVTIKASAPINTIPVYLSAGSVTPLNLTEELNLQKAGDKKVLLVTSPDSNTTAKINASEDVTYNYELANTSDTSLRITKDADDGYSTVMVYGFKAVAVNADGEELSNADFYIDGNNTVINLPTSAVSSIDLYSAGIKRENNLTEISFANDTELSALTTYSSPKDKYIEASDFTQVNTTDVWSVPYKGVIMRDGTSEFTSTGKRNGMSALYFEGDYTDFEIELSYNYNNSAGTWRWVAVGFGAEKIGDSYYDSGYLGISEWERTLRILGDKKSDGSITTYNLKSEKETTNPSLTEWYTFKMTVKDGVVTMYYNGVEYQKTLSNYSGGKIYLMSNSNKMMFKDIIITDLTVSHTSADRFAVSNSASQNGGLVVADKVYATTGETVNLTVNPDDGFNVGKIKVFGRSENGIESITLTKTASGYSFIMPHFPITVKTDFYKPFDTNGDTVLNVKDLVRAKRKSADITVLINSVSTDTDGDGALSADEILAVKKAILRK